MPLSSYFSTPSISFHFSSSCYLMHMYWRFWMVYTVQGVWHIHPQSKLTIDVPNFSLIFSIFPPWKIDFYFLNAIVLIRCWILINLWPSTNFKTHFKSNSLLSFHSSHWACGLSLKHTISILNRIFFYFVTYFSYLKQSTKSYDDEELNLISKWFVRETDEIFNVWKKIIEVYYNFCVDRAHNFSLSRQSSSSLNILPQD